MKHSAGAVRLHVVSRRVHVGNVALCHSFSRRAVFHSATAPYFIRSDTDGHLGYFLADTNHADAHIPVFVFRTRVSVSVECTPEAELLSDPLGSTSVDTAK